jgi:hypothetical protein
LFFSFLAANDDAPFPSVKEGLSHWPTHSFEVPKPVGFPREKPHPEERPTFKKGCLSLAESPL